jgi:fucose 4-O-acetylase-like acetyltransferase
MDPFNSRFILKEKRWLWVDYDKGLSIILVGYGHCLASLNGHTDLNANSWFTYFGTFFYGFRMPLFFIVSGLLIGRSLNKKGLNNYVSDRTNNILYPLLIWGIIEITFQLISARFTHFSLHADISPTKYIKLITDPRATGHFWYLNALFCIGVIYAVLRSKLKLKPIIQVILGVLMFCASAYIHVYDVNAGLFTDILAYYLFFAIGDLISNIMLDEENIKRFGSWKSFVPLLVLFVVIQYIATSINSRPSAYDIDYVEHKLPFFYLFQALVGCTISFNFSFLLQRYKVFTWLRIVGYHSLFIYCVQIIVMTLARIFYQNFLHINNVPALIMLVWTSGTVLPIFLYNFCLKYNLWWLYTFKKPEKQVDYLRNTNIFSFKTANTNN